MLTRFLKSKKTIIFILFYVILPGIFLHAFFKMNHFIRNLHVEGRSFQGTYTTKGKIPKELFIFKFRVLYSDTSEDYITLDDINGIDMILLH